MIKNTSFDKSKIVEDNDLYNGNEDNFLLKLSYLNNYKNLLIVTHEPKIEYLINYFLNESQEQLKPLNFRIVTSSIITIEFNSNLWKNISNANARFKNFLNPDNLI